MKTVSPFRTRGFARLSVIVVAVVAMARAEAQSVKPEGAVNEFGLPIYDANGAGITYTREEIVAGAAAVNRSSVEPLPNSSPLPRGFVAPSGAPIPFWQHALFGSGIGASNIVVGPAPASGAREIIIGGNSTSNFGADNFWQVIRRNATTGSYDTVFVSPIYSAAVKRIAVANITGDAEPEIVVMLADGRVYLYDFATKAELGYITTGVSGLEGLSVTDITGDGVPEVIVTTANDLYVFSGSGLLLWQLAGAGGLDVVAGQMDDDPALEIAGTKGVVVDCITHAAQWTRTGGFGAHVKLAPIPGAAYQQIIAAEAWYYVYSYDAATQLPRWSIKTPQDIGAIEVADVDNDSTPEILVGDNQWGKVHVYNLNTQALKWEANNPEHGVTNIAVQDVDNDGVVDLLWGAGWTSTGSDYLYVGDTTGTHAIKWRSTDLVGPLLGPIIGDLDGDSRPELVVCSYQSESGYSSGRILVFDMATMALRGISAPIGGGNGSTTDLKLRDLDGDGRMEIVVVSGSYSSKIEVYGFNSQNAFALKWSVAASGFGTFFNFVDVADLDGNGTPEIVVSSSGSDGMYVNIYDYPATTNPWRSVNLSSSGSVKGLVVADLDGNGSKDIAALVSTGDLYTFDGPSRQLKSLKQQTGGTLISDRRVPAGLILGDNSGVGHFWKYALNTYAEDYTRKLGLGALDGVTVMPNGDLWSGQGGILSLRLAPDYNSVAWQSPVYGTGFGRFVATDNPSGQTRVFSAAQHAVAGFNYSPSLPTPSPTPTASPSATATPTATPSATATPTATATATPTATATATPTATSTPTATATASPTATATATPNPSPGSMANISTRLPVGTGDNALIAGFIVGGSQPKKILVRGIGPSLVNFGIADPLANPTLELHDSTGHLIAFNNDWRSDSEGAISATGLAPTNDFESALIAVLPGGNAGYTAVLRGLDQGTGVGVVQVYDLDSSVDSKLVNISTRGLVQTGNNVLIAGTIILGDAPQKVIIRAIGPSLNVPGRLPDPFLELRDENGTILKSNDSWRSDQESEIIASTVPPSNDSEAAIVWTLPAKGKAYTALVRDSAGSSGIGVVEIYALK